MKKIILGLLVALSVCAFSAFTTVKISSLVQNYYYLGTDGNYHIYAGVYNVAQCIPAPSGRCIYKWYTTGAPGTPATLSPADFNNLLNSGLLIAEGPVNRRFIP